MLLLRSDFFSSLAIRPSQQWVRTGCAVPRRTDRLNIAHATATSNEHQEAL